jgi:hypothetical protein
MRFQTRSSRIQGLRTSHGVSSRLHVGRGEGSVGVSASPANISSSQHAHRESLYHLPVLSSAVGESDRLQAGKVGRDTRCPACYATTRALVHVAIDLKALPEAKVWDGVLID